MNEPWRILNRRWLPALTATLAVVGGGLLYNSWQKPIYEAKGKILFKNQQSSSLNLTNTPAQLIRSNTLVQSALTNTQMSGSVEQILDNLKVNNVGTNDVLEVSYRDTNPAQAARFVQKLMELYVYQDLAIRQQEVQTNRGQLEQQLPGLANAVKSAEANIRKFKEESNISDIVLEKKTLIAAIDHLNREITAAKSQLATAQAQSEALKKVFGTDTMAIVRSSLVSESPGMKRALASLQEVEARLASERTRFQDTHPTIQTLKSQQEALRQEVQKESQQSLIGNGQFQGKVVQWQQSGIQQDLISQLIQAETSRDGLEKRLTALNGVAQVGQKRLATFPKLEEKMNLLERDLKTATSNYEQLAERLKSATTASAQTTPLAKIVSPAVAPTQPVEIPHSIPWPWFLGSGLLLGSGLAYGLDRTDRRLKSAAAAQQIANYPMLGCIPQLPHLSGRKNQPLLLGSTDGQWVEPFRMLTSNLQLLEGQGLAQVVVITSATHGEGKSTVAVNLAVAAAQGGQKVLLVDGDLRHPQQHHLWKVSNGIGLSSLLQRETQFPESVVEVAENLELLVAGPQHENPAALLGSPAMAEVIAHWFSLYDLVIVDSTAITQSAESTLLAKMADGSILVVRPQVTTEAELKQAQDMLSQSQQRVLGMVLNGVQSHEHYQFAAVNPEPSQGAIEPQPNAPQLPPIDRQDSFIG